MNKKPEMTYEEYYHNQVKVHGQLIKPSKYAEGERRAIDWFFEGVDTKYSILDVGCGTGNGLAKFKEMGFFKLTGVELNPDKAYICNMKGFETYSIDVNALSMAYPEKMFDIIWLSHSFEHMYDPVKTMKCFEFFKPVNIYMILPYPDTGDPKAHLASFEIGSRVNDRGESLIRWFESVGWHVYEMREDNFRENEIWMKIA